MLRRNTQPSSHNSGFVSGMFSFLMRIVSIVAAVADVFGIYYYVKEFLFDHDIKNILMALGLFLLLFALLMFSLLYMIHVRRFQPDQGWSMFKASFASFVTSVLIYVMLPQIVQEFFTEKISIAGDALEIFMPGSSGVFISVNSDGEEIYTEEEAEQYLRENAKTEAVVWEYENSYRVTFRDELNNGSEMNRNFEHFEFPFLLDMVDLNTREVRRYVHALGSYLKADCNASSSEDNRYVKEHEQYIDKANRHIKSIETWKHSIAYLEVLISECNQVMYGGDYAGWREQAVQSLDIIISQPPISLPDTLYLMSSLNALAHMKLRNVGNLEYPTGNDTEKELLELTLGFLNRAFTYEPQRIKIPKIYINSVSTHYNLAMNKHSRGEDHMPDLDSAMIYVKRGLSHFKDNAYFVLLEIKVANYMQDLSQLESACNSRTLAHFNDRSLPLKLRQEAKSACERVLN